MDENNRRKLALQNKEVVYGPTEFSEDNYFKYKFTNLVIGIKKQLAESEFKLTDEMLKNYYETLKDSLYKMDDYIEVRRYGVIFKNGNADEFQQNKIIRNIQSQISKQKSKMESLNRIFKNVCEIKSQIQIFDPTDFQYMEGEECAEVLNRIGKIETGQFCPISTQADSAYFYQLLQRKPMGYRKFESVKNSLKSCYIDLLYKKYLSEMRETAIIVRY
jgi:hypothetical protein